MNSYLDLSGFAPVGPQLRNSRTGLLRSLAIPLAIFFATNLAVSAQSIPSGRRTEPGPLVPSHQPDECKVSSSPSPVAPLRPHTLEAPYRPIAPRQPLDQPKEYGPHWESFADRYGMRKSVVITGDTIEASAGLPAYARYTAILGSNFLSNTWRIHSEANAYDAILRASGGFPGRMATMLSRSFGPTSRSASSASGTRIGPGRGAQTGKSVCDRDQSKG
jgi:hypothetical protein